MSYLNAKGRIADKKRGPVSRAPEGSCGTAGYFRFFVVFCVFCGAAGAPSVLSQNWDALPPRCEIVMVVVGSGLTWGGLLIDVGRPS